MLYIGLNVIKYKTKIFISINQTEQKLFAFMANKNKSSLCLLRISRINIDKLIQNIPI